MQYERYPFFIPLAATKLIDSTNSPAGRTKPSQLPFMPDDHSEVVPLLPIPNRTVKRLCADDSADSRVKVGHRQATIPKPKALIPPMRAFVLCALCFVPNEFD
jgi:hypothetical protein